MSNIYKPIRKVSLTDWSLEQANPKAKYLSISINNNTVVKVLEYGVMSLAWGVLALVITTVR